METQLLTQKTAADYRAQMLLLVTSGASQDAILALMDEMTASAQQATEQAVKEATAKVKASKAVKAEKTPDDFYRSSPFYRCGVLISRMGVISWDKAPQPRQAALLTAAGILALGQDAPVAYGNLRQTVSRVTWGVLGYREADQVSLDMDEIIDLAGLIAPFMADDAPAIPQGLMTPEGRAAIATPAPADPATPAPADPATPAPATVQKKTGKR